MNHGPAWPDGGGWAIDPEPEVDIGARDDEPWYILYGAEYTVLLDDGRIAVPNRGSSEVFFYDRRSRFEAIVGGMGEGPGELRHINYLGPHPEGVFVTDGSSTILVFDGRHRLAQDVRLTDHAQRGDRFWPLGALADGSWVGLLSSPRDRDADRARDLGAVWLDEVPLVRLDADGSILTEAPEPLLHELVLERQSPRLVLPGPRAFGGYTMAGIGADRIFIAFSKDYSIRVYDTVDDRDYLWITEYELPWSSTWNVFTPAGVYLGQLEMPDGFELHHVRGDRVVGRWLDELDVEHVRVHRILARD